MTGLDKLPDQLLGAFMNGFLGYGNPEADLWFIGMEEAGAGKAEISRRLAAWETRGRNKFEDVADYHRDIGVSVNFDGHRPKIQRTWGGLMRIALASRGMPTDTESVRQYQATEWARASGRECLAELFPLPKRSIKDWGYDRWSSRDDLRSAQIYYDTWRRPRSELLRATLEAQAPKVVVFYGSGYQRHWEEICGRPLSPTSGNLVRGQHRSGRTLFVSIRHPVAHGLKNEDFEQLGAVMREGAVEF